MSCHGDTLYELHPKKHTGSPFDGGTPKVCNLKGKTEITNEAGRVEFGEELIYATSTAIVGRHFVPHGVFGNVSRADNTKRAHQFFF